MAAGRDRANTAEARARKRFDKMPEFRTLLKGHNRIAGGDCPRVAGLVDAEWVRLRMVIKAALSKSEGMASNLYSTGKTVSLSMPLMLYAFHLLVALSDQAYVPSIL